MFSSTLAVYFVAGLVVVLFGASLAETRLTIRINDGQETTNVDALVSLEAMVSFSCSDDAATGSLNVNSTPTTLPKESNGVWIINSMSLADQGAYQCCVESRCEEVAVISELNARTHAHGYSLCCSDRECIHISRSPVAVLDIGSQLCIESLTVAMPCVYPYLCAICESCSVITPS